MSDLRSLAVKWTRIHSTRHLDTCRGNIAAARCVVSVPAFPAPPEHTAAAAAAAAAAERNIAERRRRAIDMRRRAGRGAPGAGQRSRR